MNSGPEGVVSPSRKSMIALGLLVACPIVGMVMSHDTSLLWKFIVLAIGLSSYFYKRINYDGESITIFTQGRKDKINLVDVERLTFDNIVVLKNGQSKRLEEKAILDPVQFETMMTFLRDRLGKSEEYQAIKAAQAAAAAPSSSRKDVKAIRNRISTMIREYNAAPVQFAPSQSGEGTPLLMPS